MSVERISRRPEPAPPRPADPDAERRPGGEPARHRPRLAVAAQALRERRRGSLAWLLGLWALAAFELAIFPTFHDSGAKFGEMVQSYPDALKAFFAIGDDMTSGPGFLGAELFSMMVPLVLIGLGIGHGAAALAGEEDRGTADLLLSLPISRSRVVLEKAAAGGAILAAAGVGLVAVLVVGGAIVGLGVGPAALATAVAASVLLGAAVSSVALAVGCATGRRGLASGVAAAVAVAGYLVDSLGRIAPALHGWDRLTLFHYYAGTDVHRVGLQAGREGVLALVTVVLVGLAVVGARRRDIGR
jgi:ABC-2 type transport system permease protein